MTQATTTDQLIIDIIVNQRVPTATERREIIAHIGSANFRNSKVRVDSTLVGLQINNTTIPSKLPSLHAHWLKRVYIDLEWAQSCDAATYLQDLRQAVMNIGAIHFGYAIDKLDPGNPTTQYFVGCCCDNNIPDQNKGAQHKPLIYVVYSASHGAIVTGYQMNSLDDIKVRGDIVWL